MAWVEFHVWITTESTPRTRCFYAERCVQAALLGVPEATQQRRSQVFGDRWWFHFLALEPRTVTCITRKSMEIRDACTHGQPKWIGFGRGLFEVKMRMFLALVLLFRHPKIWKNTTWNWLSSIPHHPTIWGGLGRKDVLQGSRQKVCKIMQNQFRKVEERKVEKQKVENWKGVFVNFEKLKSRKVRTGYF